MNHVFVVQTKNINIVVDLYNVNSVKINNKATTIIIIFLFLIILSLNFDGADFLLMRLLGSFVSIKPSFLPIDKNLFFL